MLNLFDVVKVKALLGPKEEVRDGFNLRNPMAGDVAAIVMVYENPSGYELECVDEQGITQWLLAFGPDEIDLEPVA